MKFALWKYPSASTRKSEQITRPVLIDRKKSIEHGRDKNGTALMHFRSTVQLRGIRCQTNPFPDRRIVFADSVPQGPVPSPGMPDLSRQLGQKIFRAQVSSRLRDLVPEHLGESEVLKERHDIREGLVKCQNVLIRRFQEMFMEPIEQSMSRFVSDDAVGKTSEHHAAGKLTRGSILGRGKIAEEKRSFAATVISVGHPQSVRIDA